MSVVDDLKSQITAGRIIFDPPASTSARLKKELLGENDGTKASELLQKLVLEVSKLQRTRISSIVRTEGHHGSAIYKCMRGTAQPVSRNQFPD